MKEHPQLQSVDDVLTSHQDVYLDDVGELEISGSDLEEAQERIRLDLGVVWPDANQEVVARAAAEIGSFYGRTLKTGAINYGDARDLGRHVALEMGGNAMTG
jgi:hypothetical protein